MGTGTSTLPGKTKISGRKGQIRASTFARNFLSLPEIARKKKAKLTFIKRELSSFARKPTIYNY